ncbi:DNA helicase UvrD [Hydrococcus rivularis NIES-593]|uniref:DNA 3'-5' helicase n=1 Tax=Hydrococcus rivularis NIES-593 TaxID=1921803 RepID=A0A1U7HCG0_9CYAN|nr:ATP-dependent helicase [Hydrococcus rivularis]OKH21231.1 DNA helicase UvrD [Hydrococcus rivularis NIES-593]
MPFDSNDSATNRITTLSSWTETLVRTDLEEKLEQLRKSLRPGQRDLADWKGGQMAISAVPGAGKSHSLSVAAAIAIARYQLHARKQLVIVTYTRSAAASIKDKIKQQLKELQLPQTGFSVQTLHGLALNIANRHPELSGLNLDTATLITPNSTHRIVRACVEQWMNTAPRRYQILLEGVQFDGEEAERLRRHSVLRTEVLPNLAHTVIREAKSSGLSPEALAEISQQTNDDYQILAIAAGLYQQYERLMRSRDLIDYDDMILAALRVLENESIRQIWQNQVFAVFEDEAQDSSPLQEKLISILAADPSNPNTPPNLVRVGDPNQAINSTFTPADPLYFNWFCTTCQMQGNLATMDRAGRSNQRIIDAANFVLEWVNNTWRSKDNQSQQQELQNSEYVLHRRYINQKNSESKNSYVAQKIEFPFREQKIYPVDAGDPQKSANPKAKGLGLEIYTPEDIYETVTLIQKRVIRLLTEDSQRNAAILVRENRQGRFLAEQLMDSLRQHNIKVYEVGESDRFSQIPEEILKLLQFIDRPHSPDNLKAALEILERRDLIAAQDLNALATYPEQFLYPSPLDLPQKPQVAQARRYCCNLLRARLELPHYQLIPFLGMTLKYTGSELATVQKLSERVHQQIVGNSSLKTAIAALNEIVSSERFEAVEEETDDRYTSQGQLTIITMHKAKGLDWDYVFIPFLHEDVIPGKPWVPTSSKFLGNFTLAEVARAQIRTAVHAQYLDPDSLPPIPQPLEAWEEAGKLKKAEEFRLLYVAMTRAKRLLWMSAETKAPFRWNTFRGDRVSNLQDKTPCPILSALMRQFPESVVKIGF